MSFPSTFVDLQRAVIEKLRLDADADAGTGADLQRVKDWVNQIYTDACIETEATMTFATVTTTANVSSYTLPDQFVRVKQILPLAADGSTGYPLTATSLDDMLSRRVSALTGSTVYYAMIGLQELEIWPTPTVDGDLKIYYLEEPTPLAADGDVPILPEPYASKVIEYGAAAEGADFLQMDIAAVDRYRALYVEWLRKLQQQLNRRGSTMTRQLAIARTLRVPYQPSVDLRQDV